MPNPTHYYIRQGGRDVQGPFPEERIRDLIRAGKAKPTMEFSVDGREWVRGSDMPELFQPPAPRPGPHYPTKARAARVGAASPRAGRRTGGPNVPLRVGIGALVLAAVFTVIAVSSQGGSSDSGVAPTPDSSTQGKLAKRVALVREYTRAFEEAPPKERYEFERLIRRLDRLGDTGRPLLLRVCRAYIAGPHKGTIEAHRLLGDTEFKEEIPESIAFRDYPYVRAVEAANAKRWFGQHETDLLAAARAAWMLVKEHGKRLETDRVYRAVVQIRANVARDPHLRDYKYATRWAPPYLICYSSRDRLSEFDLLSIKAPEERKQLRAKIEARKRSYENILDEKARQFQETYREFMRRYRERYGLSELMAEWGGRPDYEIGERAFQNGCPLVVWIFTDHSAFLEHHTKVLKDDISDLVAGYFSPTSGMVFLYDGDGDRVAEVNKNVHEAVHQLVYWFTRQKRGWSTPRRGQTFLDEGFAEWFGSVKMGTDRKLEFIGVNVPRVRSMQVMNKLFKAKKQEYPFFPIERLTSFSSYREVVEWGVNEWRLPWKIVLSLFYQQSWALVRYLHDEAGGDRRGQFLHLLGEILKDGRGSGVGRTFKAALEMKSQADWKALDAGFRAYVNDEVMGMDLKPFAYKPPKLGEWRK